MEEPFDGLNESIKQTITNYFLNETTEQTIIISSNDESFAAKCDKVIYLKNGQIAAIGKWDVIESVIKSMQ